MHRLSICIPAYRRTDFSFLKEQDFTNTDIVLAGPESLRNAIKIFISKAESVTELDNTLQTLTENEILSAATGEYVLWLNPEEVWSNNFLKELKEHLDLVQTGQEIIYALGFLQTNSKTMFAAEHLPELKKHNSLQANFQKPLFFNPLVKYFWKLSVLRDYQLKFDSDIENWQLRHALFNLDYFGAMFELSDRNEPDYISFPLGFRTRAKLDTTEDDLKVYREHVSAKYDLWLSNPWHAVYWTSKIKSWIDDSKFAGDQKATKL